MTADTLSIPVRPVRRHTGSRIRPGDRVRPDERARPDERQRPDERARPDAAGRLDDAAGAGDRAGRASDARRASRPLLADTESAPAWMRAVGGGVLTAGLALSAAVLAWPGDAPEVGLIVPGAVAVVVGVLLVVARAGLTVTETDVVLHFRPLPPRRLARRAIAGVRVVEADAGTYGGVGLRLARRRRALILTPGAGVELTDDRGRVTFVRTRCATAAICVITGREASRTGRPGARREALHG